MKYRVSVILYNRVKSIITDGNWNNQHKIFLQMDKNRNIVLKLKKYTQCLHFRKDYNEQEQR